MAVQVRTVTTLDEAARALTGARGARIYGGGTLVMRAINEGAQDFDTVIRVTDPALRQVRPEGDRVTLGAGVTMAQLLGSRDLAFLHPVARVVGGPAVRTVATVGGNLFAETPYGDLAAALLALDGTVTLVGAGRPTPLAEFLLVRHRDPRPLVAAVTIARPRDPAAFRFGKVTRIKPKGVSLLSIAAHLPLAGGRIAGARVTYGGMAPTPVRMPAVERALEGRTLDPAGIAAALAVATDGLDPPTDALASAWYRREVAPVHLRRLLLNQA